MRIGGRAVIHETQSRPSVRLNVMSGVDSRYASLTNGVELPQTTARAPPTDLSRVVATARLSGPFRLPAAFFGSSFVAKNVSGFPKERVIGQAGILDTARFQTFIAWETGSSVKDVTAVVLGGHGDQMVSVVSATTVGGVPLRKLVSEERIQAMIERTAKGGGEVVNLLGTSAWYAPGAAAAQMVDAIMLDEKRVLPCTVYLEGEYGIDGLYMGVPAKLGASGLEDVAVLDLDEAEQQALAASANAVREVVAVLST